MWSGKLRPPSARVDGLGVALGFEGEWEPGRLACRGGLTGRGGSSGKVDWLHGVRGAAQSRLYADAVGDRRRRLEPITAFCLRHSQRGARMSPTHGRGSFWEKSFNFKLVGLDVVNISTCRVSHRALLVRPGTAVRDVTGSVFAG